jgi:hypothetical protein
MNDQEIALSYSQPTTEQHKLKGGGSKQTWGVFSSLFVCNRVEEDCIAVQPLDHRTTLHDYEQKGRKKQNTPLEQSSAINPRITQAGNKETRTTNSHAQRTQTPQCTPL